MNVETIQALSAYYRRIYACAGRKVRRQLWLKNLFCRMLPVLKILHVTPKPTPCDILFFHGNTITKQKSKNLCDSLERKSFKIAHEMVSINQLMLRRMLCKPDRNLPVDLSFDNALAKFLVRKYQPKVVCSFTESSAAFIQEELHNYTKGKNIYLPHGLPDRDFNYFCFDYYFMFGRGALNTVLNANFRIGNTKAVLTGSPFISPDFYLPPNFNKKNVLFFSSWATWFLNPERAAGTTAGVLFENTRIVITWAKLHPEFHLFIKVHPAEDPKFIREFVKGIQNITVLESSVSMIDALKEVGLVIHCWSNASIEAAVLNRPSVRVDISGVFDDYLSFEDFFLPRATNVEELHRNIVQTLNNYDEFLQRTQAFAKSHLEHTTDSVEFMADCIESIYHGEEDFSYIPIHEDLAGLRPYM